MTEPLAKSDTRASDGPTTSVTAVEPPHAAHHSVKNTRNTRGARHRWKQLTCAHPPVACTIVAIGVSCRLLGRSRQADKAAMPRLRRDRRLSAALFVVCLLPATASAQSGSLRLPTIAASAAAAADWASTYHALKNYRIRETNPLLQPFADSPGQLVAAAAHMDAGAIPGGNFLTVGNKKLVARSRPASGP